MSEEAAASPMQTDAPAGAGAEEGGRGKRERKQVERLTLAPTEKVLEIKQVRRVCRWRAARHGLARRCHLKLDAHTGIECGRLTPA